MHGLGCHSLAIFSNLQTYPYPPSLHEDLRVEETETLRSSWPPPLPHMGTKTIPVPSTHEGGPPHSAGLMQVSCGKTASGRCEGKDFSPQFSALPALAIAPPKLNPEGVQDWVACSEIFSFPLDHPWLLQ